jgi:hypothetical protein
VAHDFDADVARVAVGQNGVVVVDEAAGEIADDRESKFEAGEPPEMSRRGRERGGVADDCRDVVDDQLADISRADRNE